MSKRVKNKLDTRDKNNPGIAKRLQNLRPAGIGNIPQPIRAIVEEIGGQEDMARKYAPLILASLVDIALNCDNPMIKASTAMYLTDRIYGKSIQPLLVSGEVKHMLGVIMLPETKVVADVIEVDINEDIIEVNKIDK